MLGLAQWIVIAVAILRVAELVVAHRNTSKLLERGGKEFGRGHYPLFVLLHSGWLIALFVGIPPTATAHTILIVIFILLQVGRIWIISSLGPYWTTRIISAPDFPRLKTGPYRWFKHPNYMLVVGELLILPLAFAAWEIALVFSVLNALLLSWRIKIEESALADRKSSS